MFKRFTTCVLGIFITVGLLLAKAKTHQPTPAESVVQKYQALISSGALLTPDGWTEMNKLFDRPSPYPKDGKITVMYPGVTGEWAKGEEKALGYRDGVVVESKWGSHYGSIDSKLRYQAGPYGEVPMLEYYHVVYVDHQWKLAGGLGRSATPDKALEYVTKAAQESSDPALKRNARKTIATLKRLGKHSKACAC